MFEERCEIVFKSQELVSIASPKKKDSLLAVSFADVFYYPAIFTGKH